MGFDLSSAGLLGSILYLLNSVLIFVFSLSVNIGWSSNLGLFSLLVFLSIKTFLDPLKRSDPARFKNLKFGKVYGGTTRKARYTA